MFTTLLAAALLAGAPAPAAPTTLPPTPYFRHYDINQGLPSSNVYTIVQDRQGLIWMGTRNGLVRYDGEQLKIFQHVPGAADSLSGNDISSVLADRHGRLWASGEGGLNLFDPQQQTFRPFQHQPDNPASLAGNSVMALAEGDDGSLWVGLYGVGLDHMTALGHFEHLRHHEGDVDSLGSDNVLPLHADAKGRLWIGTDAGLDVRQPDGSIHHIRFAGLDKPPTIWHLDGRADELRASTSQGLFRVDQANVAHRVAPGKLPPKMTTSSVFDQHGALWISTRNGLYLVDPDGRTTHFPPHPMVRGAQSARLIWQVMIDQEGGLWAATQNSGVLYLSPDWRDFSHYSHRPDDLSSLQGNRILSVTAATGGGLWIGGADGQVDHLDPATGSVKHYRHIFSKVPSGVIALADTGQHGLWVGYTGGMGRFDGKTLHSVHGASIGAGTNQIVVDAHGVAYAASAGRGMYRVDPVTLQVTPLIPAWSGDGSEEVNGLRMHAGTLWSASRTGLSRLAADGLHMQPIAGVEPGVVHAFTIAGPDLWLARPHALDHYRLGQATATLVSRVGAGDGWPGIDVRALTVDQHGRVWLFAEAGMWRYDPTAKKFRRFGTEDGLPSMEFTSRELVQTTDDTLFAGTLGGVIGFHPNAEHDHPRAPPLMLTSARVHRAGNEVELPLDTHRLHLHWSDRDLRISVQALSYISPKQNHYRFRLDGFDTSWVDTGKRGLREFAGLAAGAYRLRVQAAGPSGVWGTLATPLTIQVDQPPWATGWAWLTYIVIGLALIGLTLLAWRRRLEQRHRLQLADQHRRIAERASLAKTRFLATLSHEIRTPMTGVMGMAELLLGSDIAPRAQGYARSIHHSGQLLLKLVNDALDMARIESGHFVLEPAPFQPRQLLEEVRGLLAGQLANQPVTLHTQTDADVPEWLLGDALRIKQILLNLGNNAIKFTSHGSIHIHAACRDRQLEWTVRDTGPGIQPADRERLFRRFEQADGPQRHSGSGLGLAICRELVTLMSGHIGLDSTLSVGSCFTVLLPLPAVPAPAATPDVAPAASSVALRILLVEDDPTVAEVISELLADRGHEVTHAAQGLDALVEIQQQTFDALLLDLDLPAMDGYQLTGLIRQRQGETRHTPIIAITARTGGDEVGRARDAGMDAFLRKPLTGAELTGALAAAIAGRGTWPEL